MSNKDPSGLYDRLRDENLLMHMSDRNDLADLLEDMETRIEKALDIYHRRNGSTCFEKMAAAMVDELKNGS